MRLRVFTTLKLDKKKARPEGYAIFGTDQVKAISKCAYTPDHESPAVQTHWMLSETAPDQVIFPPDRYTT